MRQCNDSDASTNFKRLVSDLRAERGNHCPSLRIDSKGQATPCPGIRSTYDVLTQVGIADAADKITCGSIVRRIMQVKSHNESISSTALAMFYAKSADDSPLPALECGSVNTGDVISLHAERGDQAGCADQRFATHRI